MANMFIEAVNKIQNLTSGNKGAPAATGNTSDTTIAAAQAETTTPAPSTPASQNTRPTPGKKRQDSAGAQALTQNINSSTTQTPSSPSSSPKTTNWRNTEAGEAISLGTATDTQKIEALEQGATAQNVGFTNVDALPDGKYINSSGKLDDTANLLKNATVEQTQTAADGSTITYQTSFDTLSEEQKAQYDTEAYADAVSRENIEKQTPKTEINPSISLGIPLDGSSRQYRNALQNEIALGKTITPGLRELAEEEQKQAHRENLIYGNFYTFWETVLKNPDGSWNLGGPMQDNLFEQLAEWDAYDGSGEYRKAKSIAAAVELPTYLIGGGLAGGAAKAAQIGITKFGATKVGGKIVDVATRPIIKPASIVNPATHPKIAAVIEGVTTPTAAAINIGSVSYAVDIGSRIAEQPTTDLKIQQALNIAIKEVPFGIAGASKAYDIASRLQSRAATKNLEYIPPGDISVDGIPVGFTSSETLPTAFKENTLIPAPYRVFGTDPVSAELGKGIYPRNAKLNPKNSDFVEVWHATPTGEKFGKEFTIAPSMSEYDGLYAAPVLERYFLKDFGQSPRPSFFVSKFGRTTGESIPSAINLRVPGVRLIDWQKVAKDVNQPLSRVMLNTNLNERAANKFLETKADKGYLYLPLTKDEYEGVIPVGSRFVQLPTRYYTKGTSGRRIPIKEYKFEGLDVNTKPVKIPEVKTETPKTSEKVKLLKTSSYRKKDDRPQLPAFSAYRPARVEAVKIPSYTKTSGNSSIKTQLPASFSSSLPSDSRVASPLSSRLSSAGPSSVKKGASSAISNKTGKSSATPYSYSGYKPGIAYPGDIRKKKEPRAKEPEYYTAARVGRIDRLSIVDPAEMIGRGSLTDRSRPDRVFSREVLYITDGQIGTKKPKGRIRK